MMDGMHERTGMIGVFDSGFGGLDVLRGIVGALPDCDFMYLGDTARTPYGSRSKDLIYDFTCQAVDFLFERDCEIIVVACNTASAQALRRIQQEYLPARFPDRRVLGVLIPFAEAAIEQTRNKRIGVIGTPATIRSKRFNAELLKLDPTVEIFQQACPLIVPLVEAGEQDSEAAQLIMRNYLKPLMAKDIDTLILGCTHYGMVRDHIQRIVGDNVRLIVGSEVVGIKLANYLQRHTEIARNVTHHSTRHFYSTDLSEGFAQLGSRFFGEAIKVEKAQLI